MAIPGFQELMLPLMRLAGDGREHSLTEARKLLAQQFGLSEDELAQLLPSGSQSVFANRVAWAKTHLGQADLLAAVRRGAFCITDRGLKVLSSPPARIDIRFLQRFPEFVEFRERRGPGTLLAAPTESPNEHDTPEEALEAAYQRIRSGLADQLLQRVKAGSPTAFEHLVLELLRKMGYGGARPDAGEATGRSGDEGIDGIINEDRLGLDTICLQAKKWEGTVGRPEVQRFVGALGGRHASKGVFITTGAFSPEAHDYVARTGAPKVVLIDGRQLAEYMIDFNLGVTTVATYETKRVDSDYFGDE